MPLRVDEDFRSPAHRPGWRWWTSLLSSYPFAYRLHVAGRRVSGGFWREFETHVDFENVDGHWDVANEACG